MKKIGIIISIIIIYFFIYFLQTNFFCWFTINGVQPNLFILLALFIGIFMGRKTGTILGVLFGLYTDFLYSNTIGISGILFGAIGFILCIYNFFYFSYVYIFWINSSNTRCNNTISLIYNNIVIYICSLNSIF